METGENFLLEEIDLVKLVQSIAEDAEIEGHGNRIKMNVSTPNRLKISANGSALESAIENIVRNAVLVIQPCDLAGLSQAIWR